MWHSGPNPRDPSPRFPRPPPPTSLAHALRAPAPPRPPPGTNPSPSHGCARTPALPYGTVPFRRRPRPKVHPSRGERGCGTSAYRTVPYRTEDILAPAPCPRGGSGDAGRVPGSAGERRGGVPYRNSDCNDLLPRFRSCGFGSNCHVRRERTVTVVASLWLGRKMDAPQLWDEYDKEDMKEIGRGSFGKVHLVTLDLPCHLLVCVDVRPRVYRMCACLSLFLFYEYVRGGERCMCPIRTHAFA